MSDLKTVLRDTGGILIIIGVITLFALSVPIFFNEAYGLIPILITSVVYFGIGIPLYLLYMFLKGKTQYHVYYIHYQSNIS